MAPTWAPNFCMKSAFMSSLAASRAVQPMFQKPDCQPISLIASSA